MRFDDALLGQIEHMNVRQDTVCERRCIDSLDHLLVIRIPLLTFRLSESMNSLIKIKSVAIVYK